MSPPSFIGDIKVQKREVLIKVRPFPTKMERRLRQANRSAHFTPTFRYIYGETRGPQSSVWKSLYFHLPEFTQRFTLLIGNLSFGKFTSHLKYRYSR